MKKWGFKSFFYIILFVVPLVYIVTPFINAMGCKYNIAFNNSDGVITRGVCNTGILKTISYIDDAGLTVSQEYITAYRGSYLYAFLIKTDVITPPRSELFNKHKLDNNIVSFNTIAKIRLYYIFDKKSSSVLFLRQPIIFDDMSTNTLHSIILNGKLSFWD